jgi:hypothetical protein
VPQRHRHARRRDHAGLLVRGALAHRAGGRHVRVVSPGDRARARSAPTSRRSCRAPPTCASTHR